jgi:hypothetical protein
MMKISTSEVGGLKPRREGDPSIGSLSGLAGGMEFFSV